MQEVDATGTRFELLHCIGRGGFGEVYRAVMISPGGLRSEVAVKMLTGDALLNADAVARFRDEARVLAAMRHRAIPRVFDVVEIQGRYAMVSEFVEGADLQQLHRILRLPPRAAVQVVAEVAGALDAAWNSPSPESGRPMRLVHRDIKPANIRIGRDGGVKLLDFGIARSEEMQREAQTSSGLLVGTMGYLAPERLTDENLAPPSDIFALGCVLYHMLCGQRLFEGVTRKEWVSMAFQREEHDDYLARRLDGLDGKGEPACDPAPEAARELLLDMLHFEADSRPTAPQLIDRCEEVAETVGGESLRRFTRHCDWPVEQDLGGELAGRQVSELSLLLDAEVSESEIAPTVADIERSESSLAAGAEPILPAAEEAPTGVSPKVVVGSVVAFSGLGAAALGTLVVIGLVAWWTWPTSEAVAEAPPVEVPGPVEVPEQAAPVATTDEEPATEEGPATEDEPGTDEEPEEPATEPAGVDEIEAEPDAAPVAAPEPPPTAPAPASRGKVTVTGPVRQARLLSGDRSRSPGRVPAGSYTLVVRFEGFDDDVTIPKTLDVSGGDDIVVTCVDGFFTCKW